jgi:hypothetical protein
MKMLAMIVGVLVLDATLARLLMFAAFPPTAAAILVVGSGIGIAIDNFATAMHTKNSN